MADNMIVLAADDDPNIREVLRFTLENSGFRALLAKDGEEALSLIGRESPDFAILDIVMPGMNGVDVCREIKRNLDIPVVFLTSKDDEIDRVVGLEIGADDYITKPFSPRELVARIRAIMRRFNQPPSGINKVDPPQETSNIINHGPLRMIPEQFKAYWMDKEIILTRIEFAILHTMLNHPRMVLSRDQLMDGAYTEGEVVSDRTIDSHIRRIRKKIAIYGGDPVETVRGLGYRLRDWEDE